MEYVDIHSILWMKLSNILQNAILFGDIVMEFDSQDITLYIVGYW